MVLAVGADSCEEQFLAWKRGRAETHVDLRRAELGVSGFDC